MDERTEAKLRREMRESEALGRVYVGNAKAVLVLFLTLACAFIASGLGWTMLLIPIFILWAIEWIASGVFSVRNLAAYYRARQARRLGD